MKAKKFLLMLVLSFSLIACSSFTFEVITPVPVTSATSQADGPEMEFMSPTPWVGGTQTAQAVVTQNALPPSEVTQAVIEKPIDFSPVLYGGKQYDSEFFLLLGGAGKDEWLTPDESVARFSGEVTYSLSNMTQEAKYFLWGKTPEFSQTCKIYTVGADAGLDEGGFIAVVDGWAVTKRQADKLSTDGEFYQQAVLDWLKDEGIKDPQVGTLQIFRVDLEGDGSDEIFISATRLDESQHTTKAGDYSIVLMRKVVGNEVVTTLVTGDVYDSKELEITYPRTYSLANFIDLNQDGVLEVIVSFQKWEGFGASVFQIDGQDVTQTLSAGC
jgi:hypothetical protein